MRARILVLTSLLVACGEVQTGDPDAGGVQIDAPIDAGAGMVTLTVTKTGGGMGSITSNPAGIDCGGVCQLAFPQGTVMILTAASTTGTTFGGWSGACSSNQPTCALVLDADTNVGAAFTPAMHTVTVTKSGTGSGTVLSTPAGIDCGATCTTTVAYGTSVTLTATPSGVAVFGGWGGVTCNGSGACTFTVTGDVDVNAAFALSNYELIVSRAGTGSGTVTSSPAGITCGTDCSETYTAGQMVTLTAAAAGDSTFVGWSGACTGSGTCAVTLDTVRTVTAIFDLRSYTLGVTKNGTGAGTVTSNPAGINCGGVCSATYTVNTMVTLTPTAASGSTFAGWAGACSGSGACTVAMTAARSVTATFNLQTVGITVSLAGTGSGTVTSAPAGISCNPTCSASFTFGTSVTLTASPVGASTFGGWSGACSGTGACVVTVMAATSVTATFNSTVPVVETLVTGLMYGFDVAPASDGYVYYTSQGGFMMNNGTVGRVLKAGGGQSNLATGQTNPFDMVQSGAAVFWHDVRDSNIKRVATTGGTPVAIARTAAQLATDGTDVYWTEGDKIARVPVGSTAPITDVITGLVSPYGIIVDATNIYWVERGATTCTFKRRAKSGGNPVTLASNVPNADRVAFDGTHIYAVVYATSGNNGSIIRVPAAGGAHQVVAANQSPFDVAVDGNHVYWTNWITAPTGVFRCTKVAGCTAEMVDSGNPNSVALDNTHVYWSDFSSIKRRGK